MSTLSVSNITDGTTSVGTGYVVNGSAKAWVQANKNTAAINESLNTSSLTDVATGRTSFSWTSAFSNGNYGQTAAGGEGTSVARQVVCPIQTPTSSVTQIGVYDTGDNANDVGFVSISAFGDLA